MLVLSRKTNQQIVIDQNILITVLEVRRGKVRFGIDAPKEVSIHRPEARQAAQCRAVPRRNDGAPRSA